MMRLETIEFPGTQLLCDAGVRKTKIGSEQGEPQKNGPRKKVFLVIWGKGWYTATDNLIMGDAIFVVTPRGKRGGRRSS